MRIDKSKIKQLKTKLDGEQAMETISGYPLYASTDGITYKEAILIAEILDNRFQNMTVRKLPCEHKTIVPFDGIVKNVENPMTCDNCGEIFECRHWDFERNDGELHCEYCGINLKEVQDE